MSLPFELMIGLRYMRAGRRGRRKDGFMSFISGMSTASIAVGVMALIIVLSVMNGFQKEVRDRMLSVLSHVEVVSLTGALPDWKRRNLPKLTGLPPPHPLFPARGFSQAAARSERHLCAALIPRKNPR